MVIKTKNSNQSLFTISADLTADQIYILKRALKELKNANTDALNLLSDLTCAINDNHTLLVKLSRE